MGVHKKNATLTLSSMEERNSKSNVEEELEIGESEDSEISERHFQDERQCEIAYSPLGCDSDAEDFEGCEDGGLSFNFSPSPDAPKPPPRK